MANRTTFIRITSTGAESFDSYQDAYGQDDEWRKETHGIVRIERVDAGTDDEVVVKSGVVPIMGMVEPFFVVRGRDAEGGHTVGLYGDRKEEMMLRMENGPLRSQACNKLASIRAVECSMIEFYKEFKKDKHINKK